MIGADELDGVFFDDDDFAVQCTRQRPATADLVFAGIASVADESLLDSHAVMPVHRVLFATAHDVRRGDTLVIAAVNYEVERVDRVNDGLESEAVLIP
jgi:hypothetical protein